MADLATTYMGLTLSAPIIAGSAGFHRNVDGVRRSADAGAGAVVLKSLFEEQLRLEADALEAQIPLFGHTEALEYVGKLGMRLGPRDYLRLIEDAKGAVSVPVIASLNCVSADWWSDYAVQIQNAGADAIELNIAVMPVDPAQTSEVIERRYLDIVAALRGKLTIPFAVKIGPYFTSLARLAVALDRAGVAALVLFNRFYHFDIDVEACALRPGYKLSGPQELHLPLRWIALLAGRTACDLAASTGVHEGADVIKQLLAGANAVQVCSALYLKQPAAIGAMRDALGAWMTAHGFETIDAFRGMLSQARSDQPEAYERLQYIKAFVGLE